jgi:ISXO2-like transposase domain
MTILEFMTIFPNEFSCKMDFKTKRENEGIICKKCSCTKHYWLQSKWQWQCSKCRFRTTLRSGTIMHSAKLSFHKWYTCMAFMSFTKKGISALEMKRQLGHKRYATIWILMHKLRNGMGLRDDKYELNDFVELDEGYFEHAISEKTALKRGRGSQRQNNVAVIAESIPLEDVVTGKKSSYCGYFKMKSLKTHEKTEINKLATEYINQNAVIFSDKSTSYCDLGNFVEAHLSTKSSKETTKTTLKWVQNEISTVVSK